eukprot:gene11240-21429_t
MSSMTTRARSVERQASVMSDGGRRIFTTSDSIDSIVAELLSGEKYAASCQLAGLPKTNQEESILYETVVSRPQSLCNNTDESNCENCKSYFPLLKSFILHLESCHKNKVSRYRCELCTVEFDSALTLAMHSLLHVAGKNIIREGVENSCTLAVPAQDPHSQSDSPANEQCSGSNESGQIAGNPLISNLLENVSVQPGTATENVSSSFRVTRRRGRLQRSVAQETVIESPPDSRSQVVASDKDGDAGFQPSFVNLSSGVDIATSNRIGQVVSALLPALQERLCEVSQPQPDIQLTDDVIRPRGSGTPIQNSEGLKRDIQFGMEQEKNYQETLKKEIVDASSVVGIAVSLECQSHVPSSQEDHPEGIGDQHSDSFSEQKAQAKANARKKRNARNQCIVCLETFISKELLRSHRYSHGDQDKWVCPDCSREFSSHWKYQDHCLKVHDNKKPFKCDQCDKCLSSFTILATHKGLHSGARPYECELCGKRYLVAAGLKDHMTAHKNQREHRCPDCGAGFNAKGDLKKHMVTHMAEKPHCCPVCNTGFNRSASLRRHMRSHTGEKPFKCDLCEKAFSRKEKMHEHRRTHTGERPLVCTTCGKAFKDSSNFSNHKKIHLAGYIPRKRKRNASSRPENINSVVIPHSQPTTSALVTDMNPALANLISHKANSEAITGKDNTLKEFATISTTLEDLQSAGQEWLRHVLAANYDQIDIRSLINAQAGVAVPGSIFNLSADDVRSLQTIINGVQTRGASGPVQNRSQVRENSN